MKSITTSLKPLNHNYHLNHFYNFNHNTRNLNSFSKKLHTHNTSASTKIHNVASFSTTINNRETQIPSSSFKAHEWKNFVNSFRSNPTPEELIKKTVPPRSPNAYLRAFHTLLNLEPNETGLQKALQIYVKLSDSGVTKLPDMHLQIIKLCLATGNVQVGMRIFKEAYQLFPKSCYWTTEKFVQLLANVDDDRIFKLPHVAPEGFMVSTFNLVMDHALKKEKYEEIERIKERMASVQQNPNYTTFLILLQAYAQQEKKFKVFEVLYEMEKRDISLGSKFMAAVIRLCDTVYEAEKHVLDSKLAEVELKNTTQKYLAQALGELGRKQDDKKEAGEKIMNLLKEKGCQTKFIDHVNHYLNDESK